jgi:hypothetical protein
MRGEIRMRTRLMRNPIRVAGGTWRVVAGYGLGLEAVGEGHDWELPS